MSVKENSIPDKEQNVQFLQQNVEWFKKQPESARAE
jgi:hypothetical protein